MSQVEGLGYEILIFILLLSTVIYSAKSSFFVIVSVLCFTSKSLAMAAARVIRHMHSPNGGIQWLQVKPSIVPSAFYLRTCMVIKIASNSCLVHCFFHLICKVSIF